MLEAMPPLPLKSTRPSVYHQDSPPIELGSKKDSEVRQR